MNKRFTNEVRKAGGEVLLSHPVTVSILGLIEDAKRFCDERSEPNVLNICATKDQSGLREEVYRELFTDTQYEMIDFWSDRYIYNGKELKNSHELPYEDGVFDAVVTTKIIFEHVSEPKETMKDIIRVLKPGGEAFLVFSFIRGLHQGKHDYFRMTEHGIRYWCNILGAQEVYIKPTNSDFITTVDLSAKNNLTAVYSPLRAITYRILKVAWLPLMYKFDRFMYNQGKYPRHYICRIRKSA